MTDLTGGGGQVIFVEVPLVVDELPLDDVIITFDECIDCDGLVYLLLLDVMTVGSVIFVERVCVNVGFVGSVGLVYLLLLDVMTVGFVILLEIDRDG